MPISAAPAQTFLAIDRIKDDVVILKDSSSRTILMCSSLNLALKSGDEQDAITLQFQEFINSLDFPVQFVVHSRRLNITPYLESLKKRREEEVNEYLKIQINEYMEFIQTLVGAANIMSKMFYAVVPFTPAIIKQKGVLMDLLSTFGVGPKKEGEKESSLEEQKTQLWQRVDTIVAGLRGFGIRAVPLNTEELIELFYGLYNPSEFEKTAGFTEEK